MNNPYPTHAAFSDYQMCKAILTLAHVPFREDLDRSGYPSLLVEKGRHARWMLQFTVSEKLMALFQNEKGFGKLGRPSVNDLTLSSHDDDAN